VLRETVALVEWWCSC